MDIKEFESTTMQHKRQEDTKKMELRSRLNKVYYDMIDLLKKWVDMPEENYKLIAIWIIGTYFHKKFDTYPFLYFNAMRGSGKTRTLNLISWLQKNGNGTVLNNPSESVIFRTAQDRGLIFDEMESIRSKEANVMREILNSAYKRGGKVQRMKKITEKGEEKHKVEDFDIFTPIVMANIQGIDEVLSDRCVTTILEKSSNQCMVMKIEDFARNASIRRITLEIGHLSVGLCSVYSVEKMVEDWNNYVDSRYTIHTLHTPHTLHNYSLPYTTEGNSKTIFDKEEFFNKIIQTGLKGRNLELFFPLLLVSDFVGDEVFEDFLKICFNFNTSKRADEFTESKDVSLIEFVSQAERHRFEYTFMNDLFREFKEFIGASLTDLNDWLSPIWMGLAMKRLNLVFDKKRCAKGVLVHLNIDKAKEKLKIFKYEDNKDEKKEQSKLTSQ